MLHRSFFLTLAAAVSLAASCLAQSNKPAASAKTSNSLFGRNLLKNGGVEAATSDNKKVPGWQSSSALSESEYGSQGGEWDWGLSGCSTCGKRYLRLAYEGSIREASSSQTVDVTAAAAPIDIGKVTAHLSAWLGAYLNSDTTATVEASFQDASGKELGTLSPPIRLTALPCPKQREDPPA